MSKVYMFKLVSGEDVVVKVISEDLTNYYVDDPLKFNTIPVPTQDGQLATALLPMPWLLTEKMTNVTIQKAHVMVADHNLPKQLEDQYLQMTSKIDLTSKIKL